MDLVSLMSSIFNVNLLILIIIGCFFILMITKLGKQRNIPPGPKGLSGIIKLFRPFAFKYLHEVTKHYGPIVELSTFGRSIVIFGNYDIIREAYVKNADNFADRPKFMYQEYSNNKGITGANGEHFKELKKFTINHLIKSSYQESCDKIILHEVELALNEIQEKNGTSFDPKQLFVQMTTNIVMRMSASERIDYNNTNDFIQKNMHEIMYFFRMSNPVHYLPPLKYILKRHKKYQESLRNIDDYLMNIVNEHENSFDENDLRDFVDAFLSKMYEEKKKGNTHTAFTKEQLIACLKDFLLAGSESSSFTLLFAILCLLHHPDIQTKVQKEIDHIIGSSRNPQMSDCSKLPFTHATILETQRICNIAPLAGMRIAKENIKLMGYDIQKGSYVIPNLYAMHLDPKYWSDPLKFDPCRFLDKNGELKKNINNFWPFCTGHRQCTGEALAKNELFLIFTSLLQRYSFKSPTSELPSIFECIEGITLSPLQFEVYFILK